MELATSKIKKIKDLDNFIHYNDINLSTWFVKKIATASVLGDVKAAFDVSNTEWIFDDVPTDYKGLSILKNYVKKWGANLAFQEKCVEMCKKSCTWDRNYLSLLHSITPMLNIISTQKQNIDDCVYLKKELKQVCKTYIMNKINN